MSDLRKAAQDLLHEFDSGIFDDDLIRAVNALRAALAAPEPEPVAYFDLQKQVFFWAKPTQIDVPMTIALEPLPLYAAPPAAAPEPEPEPQKERAETVIPARGVGQTEEIDSFTPEVYPERRHPGYIIGNHWLETAYERLCAGEAEDAILEDYELVREPRLRDLRRDAERLWQALKRYGKHDDDCGDHDAYNNESMRHCACGLDVVLDETLGDKT